LGAAVESRSMLLRSTIVISFALVCLAAIDPAEAGQNTIIPDGRTQTHITVSGNTTDITTKTIQGGNAFNSFSQFKESGGNTVNLEVPNNAQNLINLVHGGPTVIGGVLNSYKNGQIGGNVYFADPQGFIVGKSGVVNVGTLAVSTPTPDALNKVIAPDGAIDNAAAEQLIKGNMPVSPDGLIAIHGKINAQGKVVLAGARVTESGEAPATAEHDAIFSNTVNTAGLARGGAIVAHGGEIDIVAAGDATINGTIDASNTAAGQSGGTAEIVGRTVTVAGGAQITASGDAGGGKVLIGGNFHGAGPQPNAQATTVASDGTALSSFS